MEVAGYRFKKSDLRIGDRQPGISAFMRIRNGADFLELTIRSHIGYFDEIVAVYNQCTDSTAEILMRLQAEFGTEKLRIFHYVDRVFPPGSDDHSKTPADSPSSLVNYYNFSLAATRFTHATKLDDDHLAIPDVLQRVTDQLRGQSAQRQNMLCFSGLNLFSTPSEISLCRRDPISGGGDIGFFRVTDETYFTRDRRFEKFHRGGIPRRFAGYLYWHLKYLKPEMGFANYELQNYQASRYAQRKYRLLTDENPTIQLRELAQKKGRQTLSGLKSLFSEKQSLLCKRDQAISEAFPYETCDDALKLTVSTQMLKLFYQTLTSHSQRG